MSATIPIAAGMNPAVRAPSTTRTAIKTSVELANKKPILTAIYEASATRIRGRRPIRSARDPMSGAAMNAASAKDMVSSAKASTPEPNSLSRLAKMGMIMPKPVATIHTLTARRRVIFRARRGLGPEVVTRVAMTTSPRYWCELSAFTTLPQAQQSGWPGRCIAILAELGLR